MTEQNQRTPADDRQSVGVFEAVDMFKESLLRILSRHDLELKRLHDRLFKLEQAQIAEEQSKTLRDDVLDQVADDLPYLVEEEVKNQLPDAIRYELIILLSDEVNDQLPKLLEEQISLFLEFVRAK